ncbi:hypothetical protein [Desulfothermobacter acidiphilus]|uniref:hypothetical protein n=1 Tax=Desulfothermobacter acidiphilus TaxID=1938353 RepID=UPI003F8A43E0
MLRGLLPAALIALLLAALAVKLVPWLLGLAEVLALLALVVLGLWLMVSGGRR